MTLVINNAEPDSVDRIVCFSVFDGHYDSDPVCVSVTIGLLNDNSPSLSIIGTNDPYIENSPNVTVLQEVSIMDMDHPNLFLIHSATVSNGQLP